MFLDGNYLIMPDTISLRFYEELNDYLPRKKRKVTFAQILGAVETVGSAIEANGVPLSRVDLVLANGEPVDFSFRLGDGDRICVYPVFESFDISALTRLPDRPLRRPRFILEAGLAPLAERLSELGLDVKVLSGRVPLDEVVKTSREERRIVVTRVPGWMKHPGLTHGYLIKSSRIDEQLSELLARLDLG